ncbi:MAG: leucine-rich repeat protein [Prevotella sp.]|nr:leucine-rich repeat protein [Prevotella sp.]
MKNSHTTILLVILISMISNNASAYDIAVKNEDGVTLYYNYINNGTELEVTYYEINSYWNGCTNEPIVNIPEKVTYMNRVRTVSRIGDNAFNFHKTSANSIIKTVTIPNSVTSIGDNAFAGCSELTYINIPNSVM